jgi:hypothetical protein
MQMKTKQWLVIAALALVTPVVSTMAGCGASGPQTVVMRTSHDVPAAEGTIKFSETDNGNTSIEVDVRHMASPEKVATGAMTYVLWARAAGAGIPQNLGALQVDGDLRGTLKTVTPLRSFDVFITAEASPTTMAPINKQLLTASISR